ncbi:hypothetical protein Tco_0128781 [Tanacetum coccineum]
MSRIITQEHGGQRILIVDAQGTITGNKITWMILKNAKGDLLPLETYTSKVKTGLRRKLDVDEVNSGDESIIPSPKKGQREGKAVLEEKSQSKRTKKHIREEQASLAEIDELELSETQKNRMAQVQEAAKYYTEEDWDSVRAKLEENRDLSSKLKKLKPDELKEEFDKCVEKVEKFIPMNSELGASKLKRKGINLQAEVFKKQKITDVPDVTKDESVKREEEFKVQQPILRYNIRKSLARKGLQKNKSESARSDTEEDVEAYMDERVDEPS